MGTNRQSNKIRFSVFLSFVAVIFQANAQPTKAFDAGYLIYKKDTLPYRILFPENFNPQQKYPVVLFLHGAGERGSDNELQLFHGSALFLNKENRKKHPAIVIFPQCPLNDYWANVERRFEEKKNVFRFQIDGKPTTAMKLLLRMIDDLESTDYIDKSRMYVGGLSMGGMGTLELLRRKPKTFAAAVAICGGDDPVNTIDYGNKVSIWLFHGNEDDVVEVKYSEVVAAKLAELGADYKFTVYPEVKHDSWTNAFAEPDLLPWLFSKHK